MLLAYVIQNLGTPLHQAAAKRDLEDVQFLIRSEADVNAISEVSMQLRT